MPRTCLRVKRTADSSSYLYFYNAPVQGFDPDGTTSAGMTPSAPAPETAPVQTPTEQPPTKDPVSEPPTTQAPVNQPISQPLQPDTTMPYSDPAIEVDYYNTGCQNLNTIISYINNKLASIPSGGLAKSEEIRAYYSGKLSKANQASDALKCNVPSVVDINNPSTVTNPAPAPSNPLDPGPAGDNTTPIVSQVPIIPVLPVTSLATPDSGATPAGGGAGGGGGDEGGPKKPAVPPKKNWLLIAGCAAAMGLSIYQSRSLQM